LKPARRKGLAHSDTTGARLPVIDRLRGLVILMELEIILLMELERPKAPVESRIAR
jgi:hypothetical protein